MKKIRRQINSTGASYTSVVITNAAYLYGWALRQTWMKNSHTVLRAKDSFCKFYCNYILANWLALAREVIIQGSSSTCWFDMLMCPYKHCLSKEARKGNGCGPTLGNVFLLSSHGNSSSLDLLHTGVSDTHSMDTCWGMHSEGLPTVMLHSSHGFRIHVLHLPGIVPICSSRFTPPRLLPVVNILALCHMF